MSIRKISFFLVNYRLKPNPKKKYCNIQQEEMHQQGRAFIDIPARMAGPMQLSAVRAYEVPNGSGRFRIPAQYFGFDYGYSVPVEAFTDRWRPTMAIIPSQRKGTRATIEMTVPIQYDKQ
jgi:hypothetical protein